MLDTQPHMQTSCPAPEVRGQRAPTGLALLHCRGNSQPQNTGRGHSFYLPCCQSCHGDHFREEVVSTCWTLPAPGPSSLSVHPASQRCSTLNPLTPTHSTRKRTIDLTAQNGSDALCFQLQSKQHGMSLFSLTRRTTCVCLNLRIVNRLSGWPGQPSQFHGERL